MSNEVEQVYPKSGLHNEQDIYVRLSKIGFKFGVENDLLWKPEKRNGI